MSYDTDVLIVGAGPAGLTLACELTRRGIPCRVLDQARGPSTASRAKTIQPRTLEIADDLGIAGHLVGQGAVHVPTRHYDRDRVLSEAVEAALGIATPGVPYLPLWLSQPLLEQALRDRLGEFGGQVEWAAAVTGLDQHDEAVEVTLADGRRVSARHVVGCDGGRSVVRQRIGVPLHGDSYANHRWWLGDVRITGLDRHCQHLWMSQEHGILSLFPLPSTDLWQFQASVPTADRDPAAPSLALYREILRDRTGLRSAAIEDADWLSLYRVNVCLADHYRAGRVFLAGDAAHIHSPAGGQGMNTGMQDAYNLGWKLAAVHRGADPALLDTYESERRPVARAVLDDSTARLHTVMSAATRGDGSTAQRGLTGDFTTGITIAYPDSSLTVRLPGNDSNRIQPGDRAPDAECADASTGERVRVFDLLRGPHWTLLRFGGPGDTQALVDTHDVYGVRPGTSVLVRPDGYVATLGTGDVLGPLAWARPDGQ